jgi:hypothetical protein
VRFPNSADAQLHGSFYPADVYPGENVFALVRTIAGVELPELQRTRVWRVSPLGLEVLVQKDEMPLLKVGAHLCMRVFFGASSADVEGNVVESRSGEKGDLLCAIRLLASKGHDQVNPPAYLDGKDERRKVRRWLCHDIYLPICVWKHPARFNEFVFSRVRDLSAEGARIVTSMRNKFVVRGMHFDAAFNFPLIGEFRTKICVNNFAVVTEMGKDLLSIGVTFDELSAHSREIVGQYLNQFCSDVTPIQLIKSGLSPRSVSNGVTYTFVRTEAEYQSVLELRRAGYVASKKVPSDTTPEQMGTAYDNRARIVIGYYRGQIVATAALVFHEYHDQMEIEEDIDWPAFFPRKENCVEIIRLCTHASFRGTDVLLSLFNFIGMTAVQSGREFIVFGATDGLLPVYRRMGMPATDVTYTHKRLMGLRHTVVVVNLVQMMAGRTIGPIYWNAIWRDVTRFLIDNGVVRLNRADLLRIFTYELLRPFLLNRRKRPSRIR